MKISKSFVIDADVVKTYAAARDFFLTIGYSEQSAIRPTLLVLKRRGSIGDPVSPKTEAYRVNLRVSFNPVGDMQLYSATLLTIRCEYEIKTSEETLPSSARTAFETEVEKLRCHLIKGTTFETEAEKSRCNLIESHKCKPPIASPMPSSIICSNEKNAIPERLECLEIQAKLVQHSTDISIGENATLVLQITNVGKVEASITKVENILPVDFHLVSKPSDFSFEDAHLVMKGKRLDHLENQEIKLTFKPFRKGSFEIKPRITFEDKNGHKKFCEPEPVVFNVSSVVLPSRISSGYEDLDTLLLGGIPEKYAVVLTSPSSDERDFLIKKFLETGAKVGQTTFYITTDPGDARNLSAEFQSHFFLFLCNPRAEAIAPNQPNVFKLKGVENLTEIDIAMTKAFRTLDSLQNGPRRACIEIISDVLLQHHAVITRKWLSGLLADLKSKGFTTLAIVNPHMHPPEEVQAILGLFEGEFRVSEKETDKGIEKTLRIRKMYNQRYMENELALTREKLAP